MVQALNDCNLELMFRAWIYDERQHVAMRHELRERMYTTLCDAGVDMPFEHVTVSLARNQAA